MLTFTPQIQRALGDAAIVVDGDVLYLVNPKWMLVLARPEDWLEAELLNWIRAFNTQSNRYHVNWKVLTAKDVDLSQGKYLPHRSRKYLPIGLDTWKDFPTLKSEELRQLAESGLGSGPQVNLTSLFVDGKARAVYGTTEKKQFAKEPTAGAYQFRFGDKVVCVRGDWWRAFHELDFFVTCPTDSTDGGLPVLGLYLTDDFTAFGMLLPEISGHDTTTTEDAKGRKLYVDAVTCCWYSEDKAQGLLTEASHYDLAVSPRTVWSLAEESWGKSHLRLAVSILRWLGWSDADIEAVYEDSRVLAYRTRRDEIDVWLAATIKRLKDPKVSNWTLRNIEGDLQRRCADYDTINGLLGTQTLGLLPEAVALLDEALATPTAAHRRT